VKFLIENGQNIFAKSAKGETCLFLTCNSENPELANYFIDSGLDPNERSHGNYNSTPLMVASFYGHIQTVKVLLNRGADMNLVDDDRETAFHSACHRDYGLHIKLLEFFLENGFNPNLQQNVSGENGFDLLHSSCNESLWHGAQNRRLDPRGGPQAIRILIEFGYQNCNTEYITDPSVITEVKQHLSTISKFQNIMFDFFPVEASKIILQFVSIKFSKQNIKNLQKYMKSLN